MVCKKSLMECKMDYVEQAAGWSRELTRMKTRGPGDIENAMRTIEREYGVDYWLLWQLRYRVKTIKDIGVSAFERLRSAYENECDRQSKRYAHERTITETKTRATQVLVSAADTLAGTEDGAD